MASQMSMSTMPDPVIPPIVDDPPTEVPPTVPVPEPDPTHTPVLPEPQSQRYRPRPTPAVQEVVDPDTYEALYEEARRRKIRGRSTMSKTELARALGR
jgi:hypothetical protein